MICWKPHPPAEICPFCALEQAEANLVALAKVHRDGIMEQTVLRAEVQRLKGENEAIRTLMNCYNLGGWTDSISLLQENQRLRQTVWLHCPKCDTKHPYNPVGLGTLEDEARRLTELHAENQSLDIQNNELKLLLDAAAKPDCRVCARYGGPTTCTTVLACTNGNQFQPSESYPLWRTE